MSGKEIREKQSNWLKLWEGAIKYRRGRSKTGFVKCKSIEDAISSHQNSKHCKMWLDTEDGALRFCWEIIENGKCIFKQTRGYYGFDTFHHNTHKLLKENQDFRNQYLGPLPVAYLKDGYNVITGAINFLYHFREEFYNALFAGDCVVMARVGSRLEAFSEISAAAFKAYNISSWGNGTLTVVNASLEGEPDLFELYIAPRVKGELMHSGVPGRPTSWSTLVEPYFMSRINSDKCENKITEEAQHLSNWLQEKHPEAHPIKPNSMENSIRKIYNEYKTGLLNKR